MSSAIASRILKELVESIDIPDSAYDKADRRYRDLGEWFSRSNSSCARFAPHLYSQGSFRLGTVVQPISPKGEYDLDVGCRLNAGIAKRTHTQEALKALIGSEVADYRTARNIADRPEQKRRCWRLKYADELSFHMDVVPSIPEDVPQRQNLALALRSGGLPEELASRIASFTGAITDTEHPRYNQICPDWRVSNSEGYAQWFESRIKLASGLMRERAVVTNVRTIDDLPARKWKSPLQAAIQVLKRHRDVMFDVIPDRQPISVIITTLAARAYQGEAELAATLDTLLRDMDKYVGNNPPRIPNPVNPAEDFADKWIDPDYAHLDLEGSFRRWLAQARKDFQDLGEIGDAGSVVRQLKDRYGVTIDPIRITSSQADRGLLKQAVTPALTFPPKAVEPSKPAGFA
jgi:hypothetical protein